MQQIEHAQHSLPGFARAEKEALVRRCQAWMPATRWQTGVKVDDKGCLFTGGIADQQVFRHLAQIAFNNFHLPGRHVVQRRHFKHQPMEIFALDGRRRGLVVQRKTNRQRIAGSRGTVELMNCRPVVGAADTVTEAIESIALRQHAQRAAHEEAQLAALAGVDGRAGREMGNRHPIGGSGVTIVGGEGHARRFRNLLVGVGEQLGP